MAVLGSCSIGAHATRALCEAASGVWTVTPAGFLAELDVSSVEDAVLVIAGAGVGIAFAGAGFRLLSVWIGRAVDSIDGRNSR